MQSELSGCNQSECYLCGKPATTRDHIPPQGMFPKPRPDNLITVPACYNCNNGRSLDDEYFRVVVSAGSDDSPQSLNLLRQRIIPQMRERPGLILELMKSAVWVDINSPGGIYNGRGRALPFDRSRIQAVIDKVVRGLFFKHLGRRLSAGWLVDDFLYKPSVRGEFQNAILKLPLYDVGDGSVFSYRCHFSDSSDESFWFLMFYNDTSLFITQTSSSISS